MSNIDLKNILTGMINGDPRATRMVETWMKERTKVIRDSILKEDDENEEASEEYFNEEDVAPAQNQEQNQEQNPEETEETNSPGGIEDQFKDIRDDLDRLHDEFEQLMGSKDENEDKVADEPVSESIEMQPVKRVSNTDGQTVGAGGKTTANTKSAIGKNPRTTQAKPIQIKGNRVSGFKRQPSPPVKTPIKAENSSKTATGIPVPAKGNAKAELNKSLGKGNDKSVLGNSSRK